MGERVALYPGSFDPVTFGHLDIIARSARIVDKLVIGPAINIGKGPLFSLQERIEIIKDDIAEFPAEDRARIDVVPLPVKATIPAAPMASATSGCCSKNCLAFSRPWPMRLPS